MSSDGLTVEVRGAVAVLRLSRTERRNALNTELVERLEGFFAAPPDGVRAAALLADGDHYCAGLDLDENKERSAFESMEHSRLWHRAFERIELGRVPVVTAMHGAVIGGGLELALSTHVRLADPSAFYALPEGRLGIFVGGGGSVRIARVMGADRMRELMLTGRRLSATEGQHLGLSHELVEADGLDDRAVQLAAQIADNAPLNNQVILAALPRIADMSSSDGLWAESLAAALTQSTDDAAEGMRAFLEKRPPDFTGR